MTASCGFSPCHFSCHSCKNKTLKEATYITDVIALKTNKDDVFWWWTHLHCFLVFSRLSSKHARSHPYKHKFSAYIDQKMIWGVIACQHFTTISMFISVKHVKVMNMEKQMLVKSYIQIGKKQPNITFRSIVCLFYVGLADLFLLYTATPNTVSFQESTEKKCFYHHKIW